MMARAMMCAVECLKTSSASRSLGVENPHLDRGGVAIFERTIEVDDRALRDRRDRRVRQPLANAGGNLARTDPVGIILD